MPPADQARPRGHFRVERVEHGKIGGRLANENSLLGRHVVGKALVPIEMVGRAAGHHGDVRHFCGSGETCHN